MQFKVRSAVLICIGLTMGLALPRLGGPASQAEARAIGTPRCSAVTVRQNAALGRTILEEVLGQGRIEENEALYHREFVAHSTRVGGRNATRSEDREATLGWRAAAPDLRMTVSRVVADCSLVAVHFRAVGTNTHAAMGLPGTGRAFDVQGVTIFAIRDGQVAEEWTVFDQFAMASQLGMLSR